MYVFQQVSLMFHTQAVDLISTDNAIEILLKPKYSKYRTKYITISSPVKSLRKRLGQDPLKVNKTLLSFYLSLYLDLQTSWNIG